MQATISHFLGLRLHPTPARDRGYPRLFIINLSFPVQSRFGWERERERELKRKRQRERISKNKERERIREKERERETLQLIFAAFLLWVAGFSAAFNKA